MDTQTITGILVTVCIFLLGFLIREVNGVKTGYHELDGRVAGLDKKVALVSQKLNLTLGESNGTEDLRSPRSSS